ncbi:hypothetical protein QEH59_06970 [Coraliomargarita sp. SDUM461004]|uniref:Uncharacterized protein n=2 Tax=Thalassobacterium sedimentorum TaxID=3041258 RepID=A0ABU1AHF4_9BACT|nr:hypothetical protein [Coraliomargarita sp. SDUM461004]
MQISCGLRCIAFSCLVCGAIVQGGEFVFQGPYPVENDNEGSSLLKDGIPVLAGNVRGGLPLPVVSGITFEQLSFGNPISANGVTAELIDLGASIDYSSMDKAEAQYDENVDLARLMGVGYKSKYYGNGLVLNFSGLTVGKIYQLQGLYWDWATSFYLNDPDALNSGRSKKFESQEAQAGYYWTTSWKADASSQSIQILPGRSSRSTLAAISLLEVSDLPSKEVELVTWDVLNVGDLSWSEELGLWGRPLNGKAKEAEETQMVHESRLASGSLLLAARYGLLADARIERVLRALLDLQEAGTGRMKFRYEDPAPTDSNIPFFVARNLILLRHMHKEAMTTGALDVLDTLLENFYPLFYAEAQKDSAFYPNKYLGDLVGARLIQEIYGQPDYEIEVIEQRMLGAADYWREEGWGWGEHMSDTYAGVCLDLISLYLLLSEERESDVYATYLDLMEELLVIESQFGDGPRVPALRSYSFTARGSRKTYMERIEAWNQATGEITNPFWRESALIQTFYYDLDWHSEFEEVLPEFGQSTMLRIPCFDDTEATAFLADDVRLGAMSHFPIMPEAEHISWGLAWQSFPVALWKPSGDWAFLQWEVEEAGEAKAHPANTRSGARALTNQVNPPLLGQTYSLQRGGNLLVVRMMPAISASWGRVSDRFKMLDITADAYKEANGARFQQILLEYPERSIGLASFSMVEDCYPVLEELGKESYWGYNFPVEVQPRNERNHVIINIWGFSLDGEIVQEPVLTKLDDYGKVTRSEMEEVTRLVWQWPETDWDVIIDPMSDNVLRFSGSTDLK